jgi:hypothetical protein
MRTIDRTDEHAIAIRDDAAHALYEAELALHDAHQTHVAEWIAAAEDHLHRAVVEYTAAAELLASLDDHSCAA